MRNSVDMNLLSDSTATGDWKQWPGGIGQFSIVGTFGGTTATLEFLGPDGVTAVAVGEQTTLTEQGGAIFELAKNLIRVSLSGGTPTGMYSRVAGLNH